MLAKVKEDNFYVYLHKKKDKDKVSNMEDWELTIEFHWPHDRFALGWDYIPPDRTFNYTTIKFYLLFITFTLDY
jgi:hypothetical protein